MDDQKSLELYKMFREYAAVGINSYHSTLSHYLTLIAAILAGSLVVGSAAVGALEEHLQPALVMLLILGVAGPGLNAWLCDLAIRLSDRCYGIFLESIAIMAKMEPLIGLTGQRPQASDGDLPLPFPDEQNLIPDRWLEHRTWATTQEFVIACQKKGSSREVHNTFRLLKYFHIGLGILVVIASILGLTGVLRY